MSANTNPLAVGTVRSGVVSLNTATTARDGTGTLTTLLTAGVNGAIIDRVRVKHQGAIGTPSTAMIARLWRTKGGTTVLEDEVALPAATPSASVPGSRATFEVDNISLEAGEILKVSISVAELVGFVADVGGDY